MRSAAYLYYYCNHRMLLCLELKIPLLYVEYKANCCRDLGREKTVCCPTVAAQQAGAPLGGG